MTRSDGHRLLLAFAIAIALHEVAAGLIPGGWFHKAPAREVVANARLVEISVVPKTRQTPPPRHTVAHPHALASRQLQAPVQRAGAGGHRAVARYSHAAQRIAQTSVPAADPVAEQSVGADAAPAAQGAGTGDGPGAADQGSGNGAGGSDEPCGFVTFSDPHGSQYDARTHGFWVDIRMSVHFADGTSQSMILDYPWYYPNEAANPWSDQNLHNPDFLPRFQAPPPPKLANEPQLVRYVIAHSTAAGLTLLNDCPSPPPSPAARL